MKSFLKNNFDYLEFVWLYLSTFENGENYSLTVRRDGGCSCLHSSFVITKANKNDWFDGML